MTLNDFARTFPEYVARCLWTRSFSNTLAALSHCYAIGSNDESVTLDLLCRLTRDLAAKTRPICQCVNN